MSGYQYQYDDGSALAVTASGDVLSREIGSGMWQDDPSPAPPGWNIFNSDALEAQRMSQAYPQNGKAWDENAATFGISRLVDTAARAWVQVKGNQAATYAGQNGQTYVNGQAPGAVGQGGVSPLLLIGIAAFLLLRGG